jgi:hypothetical protein
MAPIPVPKPPRKAYNPKRRAGTLLQNQLRHLEWAVRPAAARTHEAFRIKPATTEAEAAARIGKLTQELHRQATSPTEEMPPEPAPLPPAASKQKPKSKPKSRARRPRSRTSR